jgi:hypothetical protein
MKFHKIRRLEFVSDKIEDGDYKREVMCIRFGHPAKKMSLCEALHGRQPWPELELPWEPMGSSPERGKRGKGKRERGRI